VKNLLKVVWIVVLALLGVWLWFVLFPSPEKIIRHRLEKLAHTVSFSKSEGNFSRIASAESVSGFFSTNVEVAINVPGYERQTLVGRAEITQDALASRTRVSELSVKFPDVNVTVAPDRQSATADVTVEANVADGKDPVVQEVKFTFEKTAEGWLINRVETVRPLS
jgi:ketosteroid isomerase-like protein